MRLLPTYRAARELGLGEHFLYQAVRAGVLPEGTVIRVGRRKALIDLGRADEIIEALARWTQGANAGGDAWLRRQIERAGGRP